MKKQYAALLLGLSLLLTGCQQQKSEIPSPVASDTFVQREDIEPTAQYDWMSGQSPVENKRIGVFRAGLPRWIQAVSPTGTYFVKASPTPTDGTPTNIMYVDHGSDRIIKLCGRPDCTHTTTDCNSYIFDANHLCFYSGYLFLISGGGMATQCILTRMDADGSNHVSVLDLNQFAKEHGGDYADCEMMNDGVLLFSTYYDKETPSGQLEGTWLNYYIYRLDGSMEEPKAIDPGPGAILYSCGDVLLTYRNDTKHGGEYGSYWNWDLETDTLTYLTDHPGQPGWFTETEGYYFKDGAICRLTYATQTEERMVETGLEGNYYAFSFPDCIVLGSRGFSENSDNHLYVYNWSYELVDTIEITYPHNCGTEHLLIAETAERFILSDSNTGTAQYYINKSELGTGDVKIHPFKYGN